MTLHHGTKTPPKVGETAKVFLPGESPWAECLEVLPDGRWVGQIENTLVAESAELRKELAMRDFGSSEPLRSLHDFKKGDRVIFRLRVEPDYQIWVPDEPAGGKA